MLEPAGAGGGQGLEYNLVGNPVRTFRVNNDGTTTAVVNITAQSILYGVQFTFTILASTYDQGNGPTETAKRTEWVNAVCAYPHVIGFHTETDQGPDQVLYNYAVISVGEEGTISGNEVRQRMDHLGDASTFTMIDNAWNLQTAFAGQ